jgi:hypothetical protein
MNELEARLEAALKASDPPARDPLFRIELMVRHERMAVRRRVRAAVATAFGLAVTAALGAALLGAVAGDGTAGLAATGAASTVFVALLVLSSMGIRPKLPSSFWV